MAKDSSFDIVSKVDMAEVQNAVNQATAEIKQRFDFKGSKAEITLDHKEGALTLLGDSEPQLKTIIDILQSKFIKRGVPIKALIYGDPEPASGGMSRQKITLQQGIPTEKAREIVKLIKQMKNKTQAAIQDDQVRVSGKNRDDLQAVIAMLKEKDFDIDMQFVNYR
ncbi:MAG: YajQ family cyclic di-GMP-binding protein [Nitrospinota bacterium]|nr:YajQ family cyclic di-GMP-binding protein [Nitrospinota bacterium]MDH5679616.1 YajQ family cyclic di-GMP-binding protein [Nitrospinota bacterium]MDH5757273.1 YajQ family cyclic di-GMP-binding protein [Nitrospinota bacterium]